jgi:hypothetical protein
MNFDQKIKYALLAFTITTAILAGMGLHAGVHHIGILEKGGRGD